MIIKRILLEILQHILAAGAMLAVAFVLFHSYIGLDSLSESSIYWIDALNSDPVFEDTDVYLDIIRTQSSDILRFVSLRILLEQDGKFNPNKRIDVTAMANQGASTQNCPVTLEYYLDELIKWGKSDIEFHERFMSISDFVNYYGPVLNPEFFTLDSMGNLMFLGFASRDDSKEEGLSIEEFTELYYLYRDREEKSGEDLEALSEKEKVMLNYSEKELEQMAFSYIMAQKLEEISLTQEEDGSYTVRISMVRTKYDTIDGKRVLTDQVDNWIDYIYLQRNLVYCIQTLSDGYDLYLNGEKLYGEGCSNFYYVVRLADEKGKMQTFSNLPALDLLDDSSITEHISEYRRYLIYYLDELAFTGVTRITESDLYRYMKQSFYRFPENTRIWMAVDTAYPVADDALNSAYQVFERIIPNIPKIIGSIVALFLVWTLLFVYLSATAGLKRTEFGGNFFRPASFDKIWTEVIFILMFISLYAIYRAQEELNVLVEVSNELSAQFHGEDMAGFYEYGLFAFFGALVSFVLDLLWFSIMRRIRCGLLWKNSLIHKITLTFSRIYYFISRHSNSVINTLLPYNLFLLANGVGIVYVWVNATNENYLLALAIGILVIAFDAIVGVSIFRNNAEKNDIVEGINRIRSGEVDYKIKIEDLSGINRELADAVNNIGEGIRNAVNTSMKDEQMKSDLITNVSHDLKTPLTSIINYVDLLKRTNFNDENAKKYLEVLDTKAQRLKQLTDDLVEASKISSGNITLQMEKIDPVELLKQAMGEFSEKMEEKGLNIVLETEERQVFLYVDSRRTWRIIDNLFNNIYKYALENTRVYIEVRRVDKEVEIAVKNISARQIHLKGEELAERFIRGDEARTSEGSGLGLFIAKSLTQVQGGSFEVQLDGDLFKVVLLFPEYHDVVLLPKA